MNPFSFADFIQQRLAHGFQVAFHVGLVGQPISMSRSHWEVRNTTPEQGEHTDTILGELGYAPGDPGIGWYVGYVETARGTWFFALNLDIRNPGDLPLRQKIAREALRAKGIIH